jgi:hypothetical protein
MFFLDDTSIIVTNSNQGGLQKALNKVSNIISWLKANFLSFNFNKTYYLKFRTKNCIDATIDINSFNKPTAHTKFLGLVTDDTLTWDNHTDQSITRLNSACYAITAVKATLSKKALRMLNFSYVHSIIP